MTSSDSGSLAVLIRWIVWSLMLFSSSLSEAAARPIRASFYGEEHRGRLMTNGQRFNPDKFTCASWDYPLGSVLEVSTERGFSVRVVVTDRGPAKYLVRRENRRVDLSLAAFSVLAGPELGIVDVRVKRLK